MAIVIGIGVLLFALLLGWFWYSNRVEGIFKKYLPSKVGSFTAISMIKRPNTDHRAVITEKGEEPVWLNGGYKGLYGAAGKLPFVNFHAERSPKDSFEANKQTIESQYTFVASHSKTESFSKNAYKNYTYFIVGDSESVDSGVKDSVTLFFPEDSMLVTMYFLNQGPNKEERDYDSSEEYKALRDKFIQDYVDSVLAYKSS